VSQPNQHISGSPATTVSMFESGTVRRPTRLSVADKREAARLLWASIPQREASPSPGPKLRWPRLPSVGEPVKHDRLRSPNDSYLRETVALDNGDCLFGVFSTTKAEIAITPVSDPVIMPQSDYAQLLRGKRDCLLTGHTSTRSLPERQPELDPRVFLSNSYAFVQPVVTDNVQSEHGLGFLVAKILEDFLPGEQLPAPLFLA
jgi:hypothetical protein